MQLHGIKAKNFLSLHDCTITDLDPHLNFIVGPNGSGKTNIFRLLKTIRDVFAAAGAGRRSALGHLCTQGVIPQGVDVSITVEFDTRWEQDLISAFLCAALSHPTVLTNALTRLRNQSNVSLSRAEHLFFAEWLARQIRPETVPFFFRGVLRVTYRSDIYDYLLLSYTFECKGEPVTIIMGSLAGFDGVFWRGDAPEMPTHGPYPGGDVLLTFLWEPRTHKEQEGVLGESATSNASTLSDVAEPNLQEAVLEESATSNGSTLSDVAEPDLQELPEVLSEEISAQEENVEPLLDQSQLEQVDEPVPQQAEKPLFEFFNQQPGLDPADLDTEAFFLFLADKKGFLEVEPLTSQYAALPTYSTLSEASGIDFRPVNAPKLVFSALFSLLVNQACVFTNNVRVPFSVLTEFNTNEALSQHMNLENEQQIPQWLFRLKVGDRGEQERFRRIQESFSTLAGENRWFDLTVKLTSQQSAGTTVAALPTLDIRVMDTVEDISLAYQGAGVWEALVLSTLLDESEGRLVLLDEPAANLHPGMQHKLIEILRGAPGQVLAVTHSAHLLPTLAEEFQRVYRMQKSQLGTQIFSLGNTFAAQQDKLENELRTSSDIAGLLFANGVLLVEGPTEIGAFGQWFPQSSASQGKTFADLNIVLHALNGKPEIPFYLRFLTAFGVPWAVICDGDALSPSNTSPNDKLWKVLKDLQLLPGVPSDAASFEELKAQAASIGIYTYNTSSPVKFETIPEVKNFLDMEWTPHGKTAYRGRYIAIHLSCPSSVEEVFQQSMTQLIVP